MELRVNGDILPIAQLAPDFLILKNPVDHPPADAEIRMSIDGHERRWLVRLHDGISAAEPRTRISGCRSANGAAANRTSPGDA
ncbi:MAG TPA: hypothetical protein VFW33_20655 [Gemmataceae bacterium]|nr:hypothetical protein [Gemmataceae bacterium]